MENYSTPKAMKQMSDLFEKYKNHFKPPQASVEKVVVEAIEAIAGFEVSIEQVTYTVSTKTVSLAIPSILKTELRMRQKDILEYLQRSLGKNNAPVAIL
ncbi:MAG: hypothetical protein KC877_01085 [Candidatus Kaiserbacteria bacterium]|nr:hypothetical protein [Candidatus Kaiserbacteria bacterium]MCB9816497.1 hypothetical protein [Candidatus Nomurabacteria bacterium]